ncbi:30S ribosomal protein S7 [Candidatus Margulisiibacteriota bacterium]
MTRSGKIKRNKVGKDSVYGSEAVQRFINKIMSCGKKSLAERIVYNSLKKAAEVLKKEPMEIFEQALRNVVPIMEVKARRVGGATYQVPVEVKRVRGISLAMGWLKKAALKRSGRGMIEKLSYELVDAFNNTGGAVKTREDSHKTAEANKAFAHFRW